MILYLRYSNLVCKISSPEGWNKYFQKLYENSDIIEYSEKPLVSRCQANLDIVEVNDKNIHLEFITYRNLTKYTIKASAYPLFLFPSVHQFVSRIFNILHHLSGGFVLHASSILINDKAIVFVGESGRGKSTLIDLIHKENPQYTVISDNSAFISRQKGEYVIYPSPYLEANRLGSFQSRAVKRPPYKIHSVFFPFHNSVNIIKSLDFEDRLQLTKINSHIPYQADIVFSSQEKKEFAKKVFGFITKVPMYKLEFAKDRRVIYNLKKYVR